MSKRILAILILAMLVISSLSPLSVYAIAIPDSPPTVDNVIAYDLEDGGLGVLVDYTITYTTLPTETATSSFLVVFVDTDGTTHLRSVAPYTFSSNSNKGYRRGVAWIQFTSTEVATLSIDSADQLLYKIWVIGSPTLAWGGALPKTVAGIGTWKTAGDMKVMLAVDVLYYATILEGEWSLNLVTPTALGKRLTTYGEEYFESVIPDLRALAPNAFSSVVIIPVQQGLDYVTGFGAVIANGPAPLGGTLAVSPLTLVSGNNTVNVTGNGTFTITLSKGTIGTASDGAGGVITGSPVTLASGRVNTITTTNVGTIIVNVTQSDVKSTQETGVTGTGFDLTELATALGMSRWFLSGLVWLLLSVAVCAAIYKLDTSRDGAVSGGHAGKAVMLTFDLMILGGGLLGLIHPLALGILVIGFGMLTGYVLFFKSMDAAHSKGIMFMAYTFLLVTIVGNVLQGSVGYAVTSLTTNITSTATTINVSSTTGFPETGIIVIGEEKIAYGATTATSFIGGGFLGATAPLIRGTGGTEAIEHVIGARVFTPEGGMFNTSMSYHIAVMADASGLQAFVAKPIAFFQIIGDFLFLPLNFFGTDLMILGVLWTVVGIGMLVSLFVSMAGGRRI